MVNAAAAHDGADGRHDLADVGIGFPLRPAAEADAHLGAVAAAPDRTVVDEGDLYALTRSRNRGAHSCHAAAHNDEGVVDQLEKMIPTFTPTRKNLKT